MKNSSRRKFFKWAGLSLLSLPLLRVSNTFAEGSSCKTTPLTKEDLKARIVPLDDPMAKRLNYVENYSDTEHPSYQEGQLCNNCRFYRTAQETESWAPCTMLANRLVPGCGWCSVWQPMA